MSMICGLPVTCPHGTRRTGSAGYATYADGCLTTSTLPRLFWSERDRKGGSLGTAIWPNEYLRDWDEALILNAGDELYDEAMRTNEALDAYAVDAATELGRHPGYDVTWGQDPIVTRQHADYLREVPWTDRVED